MFRYIYSVLLLAVTKPACDHIIRIITRNTDGSVENSTLAISMQLQKLRAEIKNNALDETLVDKIESIVAKLDIGKLHEEIAELRGMVLESRTAAHKDAMSLHDEHVQMYKLRTR